MYEFLRSIPPERRRNFLPFVPRGWAFFRRWRSVRWFVALLVPVVASAVVALDRGRAWWEADMLAVLGLAVTLGLFVTLSSGISVSNTGTYLRWWEPVRFWWDVAVLVAAYVGIALGGYVAFT